MSFWAEEEDGDYDDILSDSEEEEEEEEDDAYYMLQNLKSCLVSAKAEYAFEMSRNSQLQSELEQSSIRIRRRQKLLGFYDDYTFHDVPILLTKSESGTGTESASSYEKYKAKYKHAFKYDEKVMEIDIDKDYQTVIRLIQLEETERLRREEEAEWILREQADTSYRPNSFNNFNKPKTKQTRTMTMIGGASNPLNLTRDRKQERYGRMRSKSAAHVTHANILYQVSQEERSIEKQWMKMLRRRRFNLYMAKQKAHSLRKLKNEYQHKLKELEQQIGIKERITLLTRLRNESEALTKSHMLMIENACQEIDSLRGVVDKLNKAHAAQLH
mmetsp:Transcript_64778/g.103054  ORF Transcript_64778/g.103054 Transcript_64778/m.103054 type:complete len:329 (+) Transcript_64778:253-1239(+)